MDMDLVRVEALKRAQHDAAQLSTYNSGPFTPTFVIDVAREYADYISGRVAENEKKKAIKNSLIDAAAQAAHEAIRTLQIENNEPNVASPWNKVGQDIKDSYFIGIDRVIADPSITNEELHDSWIETKISQGWSYGTVRDDEEKLHPCMVPYNELPPYQRLKDAMFRNVVKAVLGLN